MRNLCLLILAFPVLLLACKQNNKTISHQPTERDTIANYLKSEFRIAPKVQDFDTLYLAELKKNNKNLDSDSLISDKIRIYKYQPLNLEFISFSNNYYYKQRTDENCFGIYFIRNLNTGKFYLDHINPNECLTHCMGGYMYTKMNEKLKKNNEFKIPEDDINVYNSIHTNRIYGEAETSFKGRNAGIELFLNDEYRFFKPSKSAIDSLFNFYDRYSFSNNSSDTLLRLPEDLFKCLTVKSKEFDEHGDKAQRLIYLKEQINLLILKNTEERNPNTFLWVYKSWGGIRVRSLLVKGNSTCGYTYFVDESWFSFL